MLQDGDTIHCITMAELPGLKSEEFKQEIKTQPGIANVAMVKRSVGGSQFTFIVPLETLGASAARKAEYDYFRQNFKVGATEPVSYQTLELQPGVLKGLAMQRQLVRQAAIDELRKDDAMYQQVAHRAKEAGKTIVEADQELSSKIPVVREIKAVCRQSTEAISNTAKSAASSLGF
jgi:hypothetical protein